MNRLFVLIIFFIPLNLLAQSVSRESRALFFAVNDYDGKNEELFDLDYPISDAKSIANLLKERYGFRIEVVENPTYYQIMKTLDDYRKAYLENQYDKRGQLLIFISGHGLSESGNGYFLPTDTKISDFSLGKTALNYHVLRNKIAEIDCQHILVAIDACHSISFKPDYGKERGFVPNRSATESYDQSINYYNEVKSRIFFTSDALDQPTPDKSNFARQLFNGLSNSPTSNGYLRYDKLFSDYLETVSPKPSKGTFGQLSLEEEGKGTFLFFTDLKNKYEGISEQAFWKKAEEANAIELYNEYINLFPSGDYVRTAKARIKEIECVGAWNQAKYTNTIEAYQAYIQKCPNTVSAEESALAIEELKRNETRVDKININIQTTVVKTGEFRMGGSYDNISDEHTRTVRLDEFEIGKYEITFEEFDLFCKSTGIEYPQAGENDRGKYPVVNISWFDAIKYCNWLSEQKGFEKVYNINGNVVNINYDADGFRLPTEAEWEYAASFSANKKKSLFGNGKDIADPKQLNFDGSQLAKKEYSIIGQARGKSVEVGVLNSPNSLGLHDMSGNVQEWCNDWYEEDYYNVQDKDNPKGPENGRKRVVRGGDYTKGPEDILTNKRMGLSPITRSRATGFRIARSIKL